MLNHFNQLLLRFEQGACVGFVEEFVAVFLVKLDLIRLASVFELGQILHVFCHVSAQDHSNHSLSKHFDVIFGEVFKEVERRIKHNSN